MNSDVGIVRMQLNPDQLSNRIHRAATRELWCMFASVKIIHTDPDKIGSQCVGCRYQVSLTAGTGQQKLSTTYWGLLKQPDKHERTRS
jgi:hypothetical protein